MKETTDPESGQSAATRSVCWRSPSNIAIIKYWGKHGEQLPNNPSVSLTLKNAHTRTQVDFHRTDHGHGISDFRFDDAHNEKFKARLKGYINRIAQDYPALRSFALQVASGNSFPHSAGIASSASAMSALALCLCTVICPEEEEFMRHVSHIARLGSGSACRSVYAPVALWGETDLVPGSSDMYAIPIEADAVFHTMCDAILIVEAGPKAVSSSEGHALMQDHVYASARNKQALEHLQKVLVAIKTGDMKSFGEIAEAEALALHAMMMTSDPAYLLMKGATVEILDAIRDFRRQRSIPVYFTLDAGPNVHVLYPRAHASEVRSWIDRDLLRYCSGQKVIYDQVGPGPERIA